MSELFDFVKSMNYAGVEAHRQGRLSAGKLLEREIMRLDAETERLVDAQLADKPVEPGAYGIRDVRELIFAKDLLERLKKSI